MIYGHGTDPRIEVRIRGTGWMNLKVRWYGFEENDIFILMNLSDKE